MDTLYLFAKIAGTDVAIPTDEIEAVVRLTDVTPVFGVAPRVAGLSALRSRVLTIIDTAATLNGERTPAEDRNFAVIVNLAGHSYGLMVDSVSDISAAPDGVRGVRGQLDPRWRALVQGVVEHEGRPHLLVATESFIDPPAAIAA